jgi:hypothetical protein
MNERVECLRCHAQMESGFVPDNGHSGFQEQKWFPGEPEPSFWMGLKLKADLMVPVRTLRCPKCGYLESYAVPKDDPDR